MPIAGIARKKRPGGVARQRCSPPAPRGGPLLREEASRTDGEEPRQDPHLGMYFVITEMGTLRSRGIFLTGRRKKSYILSSSCPERNHLAPTGVSGNIWRPTLNKRILIPLLLFGLLPGLVSPALSKQQLGAIKGRIADNQGFPLPGAFVYVQSPSLIGVSNYITDNTGNFAFPNLFPGIYKIIVEMPGFKTANIDSIPVHTGSAVFLNVKLEASQIEEEVTLKDIVPIENGQASKKAVVIGQDLLKHLPLGRSLAEILKLAPGVVLDPESYDAAAAISGSTVRASEALLDGINLNDPATGFLSAVFNFDAIEEIEIESSGHPAASGPIEGGRILVVGKFGGGSTRGSLSATHNSKGLSQVLWKQSELDEMKVRSPLLDKSLWDMSFSLGGPILSDRAWFFGNARFNYQSRNTDFLPWTDPQGQAHNLYDWSNREIMGFFKLSGQATSQIRFHAAFNYFDRYRPVAEINPGWNLTQDATHVLDHLRGYTVIGAVNIKLNQNSFIDVRAGLISQKNPWLLNSKTAAGPQYVDAVSGRIWGSADINRVENNSRLQAGATITRFQDGLLIGGRHELKAGGEYEQSGADFSDWKADNLLLYYAGTSPYLYGLAASPTSGNTVGKGRISFFMTAGEEGGHTYKNEFKRLGAFVQDSATFGERVTLNLGFRFDRSFVQRFPVLKGLAGNLVSAKIGDELIKPIYGINPYDLGGTNDTDTMIAWNGFSPRAGLSIDLFKNGRTLLKASFSRIPELLGLQYSLALVPMTGSRRHSFYWYDENMDGQVDTDDSYALMPDDYRIYDKNYYNKRFDPELAPPYTSEFTAGLTQKIFQDFTLDLRLVSKSQSNLVENVLYSPDLNQDWYALSPHTEAWWVPFQTLVPGIDSYGETPVTVYFRSNKAPALFDRLKNVPELERTYRAAEFSFEKRMSHNWQLSGSLVLGRARGFAGLNALGSSGFTDAASSPNAFVNVTDKAALDLDRPVVAKIMGTYKLPYELYLSAFFIHASGAPWARSVTVYPPASWAEANDVAPSYMNVYLEAPGTWRFPSRNILDLRIEKDFTLKRFGHLRAYLDILNVTGSKYSYQDLNDGGMWFPESENSVKGTRILSPYYKNYLLAAGVRTVRLNLTFMF